MERSVYTGLWEQEITSHVQGLVGGLFSVNLGV